MKNLSNYKIVRINYPFSANDMEEFLWNKMTLDESKWAIQLTLKGINDTGGDESKSWDIFFLEPVLRLSKIVISLPSANKVSQRWDPINPAPPVINTRTRIV